MKNAYEVNGDTVTVFLRNRKVGLICTYVSTADLHILQDFPGRFHANLAPTTGTYYAIGEVRSAGKRQQIVKMHRLILDAPSDKMVDHINGDTLDNRRSNLRFVTAAENSCNRVRKNTGRAGYPNVYWFKRTKKWRVVMHVKGVEKYFGYFSDLNRAVAKAKEVRKLYAPYAFKRQEQKEVSKCV